MADLTNYVSAAASAAITSPFGAMIRLEPTDGSPLWIDGRTAPVKILAASPAPDDSVCVWKGTCDTLVRALEDERALSGVFLSGRLVISGDMSVMARLQLKGGPRA